MSEDSSIIDEQTTQIAVSLDSRTLRLLELLSEKSEDLANMLKGAWVALNTTDNPDVLPQVAHSVRELMEKASIKLPDVPIEQGSNNLKNDVSVLNDKWSAMAQGRQEISTWRGEIDETLREILRDFDTFFADFSTKYQPRNEQNATLIQALDESEGQMPAHILSARLKQWNDIREFFLSAAHHGKPAVTADEVAQAVANLEEFLLDLISPEPIPDINALDILIAEGEAV